MPKVGLRHIIDAYDEMANSKTVKVLKGLRKFEIIVIISLFLELKTQRTDKVLMDSVQDRCEIILNQMKDQPQNLGAKSAMRDEKMSQGSDDEFNPQQ